jgi:zinc transport system substrate-binding protein
MYTRWLVVVAVGLMVVCLGRDRQAWAETHRQGRPRLKVAATIFPLYDLVRNVAGPEVEVVLLVPPGASPHTFAAKPSTIRDLASSAVIFTIGHGLDGWAVRLAQEAGITRTIVVDAHIPLQQWEQTAHAHGAAPGHAEQHGAVDPHYWLAIPNAVRMVQSIAETLESLDPGAKGYLQRAAAYQKQLYALDHELRQLLAPLPRRDLAVFHPAFGYFATAYGLHIVATFEPSPGQEPTPRHVEHFLRQVQAHKLRVLFIEPQLPQGPLTSVARDMSVTLKELDPLGGGQGRDSYIAMMRFNAVQIATALRE